MTQQSIVPVNHRVWSLTMTFSYLSIAFEIQTTKFENSEKLIN